MVKKKAKKKLLKVDLGCGKGKQGKDWIGVDLRKLPGVDLRFDIGRKRWPWRDGSVDQLFCRHTLEHLDAPGRYHFWRELYRVLAKDGEAKVIVPAWQSGTAYADLDHKWPPFSEASFFPLRKEWREANADHEVSLGQVDLHFVISYNVHPIVAVRADSFKEHAVSFYKDAVSELHVTLTKKKPKGQVPVEAEE